MSEPKPPEVEIPVPCRQLRVAISDSCGKGHTYYREAGVATPCPFCLIAVNHELRERMHRARMYAQLANEGLDLGI